MAIAKKYIITIIKYLFSFILCGLTIIIARDIRYGLLAMGELLLIIFLSNIVVGKFAYLGNIMNNILCLLLNVQLMVFYFAFGYIRLIMLTNISSLQGIAGKAFQYGIAVVLVLLVSFLPIRHFEIKIADGRMRNSAVYLVLIIIYGGLLFATGIQYSPLCNYGILINQADKMAQLRKQVTSIDGEAKRFYSSSLANDRPKDKNLTDSPNVILIFTEGLSQNIVTDERQIMPNVRRLEENSIFFDNYYNHTFATYRGISGQLYSGYQLDNLDKNKLVSLQSVLKVYNYHTAFIDTEPDNTSMTEYLNAFDFDEVIAPSDLPREGAPGTFSDKQAYELLFEQAGELSQKEKPFFLSMYTYGTHVTLNSTDKMFGDGKDHLLNKFFNVDQQFGTFFKKFNESSLSENTVIVFTTDHAAFQNDEFISSFPDYKRDSAETDNVPFCIYYKGIQPEIIDAEGRNSLDMTPTLLDYLDCDVPNYFLGSSLFGKHPDNKFDTIFNEETNFLSTLDGKIRGLNSSETAEISKELQHYFVAKLQDDTTHLDENAESRLESQFEALVSEDKTTMFVRFYPKKDYKQIWFPVWSSENEQDDKIVYPGIKMQDGSWITTIDLRPHTMDGELNVHAYGGETDADELLSTNVMVVQ